MDIPSLVFLSFNQEDTCRTFVSHLYRSLDHKRIPTYKDKEHERTEEGRLPHEVSKAIEESTIAIVVISENYASSVWCLEVLAEIMEKPYTKYHKSIRAVFYEVDPGDLTGKFGEGLRRHEERETPETVNRWRTALKRLEASTEPRFCSRNWVDDSKMLDDLILSLSTLPANYTGPEKKQAIDIDLEPTELILTSYPTLPANYSGPEKKHAIDIDLELTELILTSDTHLKHLPPKSLPVSEERQNTSFSDYDSLDKSPSDDSNVLVGMYRHKIAVYDLLDLETMMNNARTVGICGESGVGKTTLAECVFNDISPRFQHYCFLSSVNNIYRNRISPSLLQHLTSKKRSDNIFDAIKPFLVDRNVLLVIDGSHDTADHMQLKDAMKVSRWLGPGSRVIITSGLEKTLKSCGVKYIYKMESLRYEEALQLFFRCAFKMPYPLVGFEEFSVRAVHFAGRLPLALKVVGSFLYDKDLEIWKRTLCKLETSQDKSSRRIANYIRGGEYIPRRQTELEHYVRAEEEKQSASKR